MDRIMGDYHIIETIFNDTEFAIYRAEREGEAVLVKAVEQGQYTRRNAGKLAFEYSILQRFAEQEAADYGFSPKPLDYLYLEKQEAIVMSNAGGCLLLTALPRQLTLTEFLHTALALARALAGVHKHDIIHCDINPGNLLITGTWGEGTSAQVINFGLASKLREFTVGNTMTEVIEGDLPYVSPEKTGLVDRHVDYRTDLYSLGVVFYELLTGTVPFTNPEELRKIIFDHISTSPKNPRELRPTVPQVVADMVLILLNKAPNERYQSADVLIRDIQQCLDNLSDDDTIAPFTLAKDNHPRYFAVSEKIYGREQEIDTLQQCFARVRKGGTALAFVSGYSGIGKTTLINQMRLQISRDDGFFVSGKFNQYAGGSPYTAWIDVMSGLLRYVYHYSEEDYIGFREALEALVTDNIKILTDLVPNLNLLIKDIPPLTELDMTATTNRFHYTVYQFFTLFGSAERPVLIFLDDLQWADLPSLNLLLYLSEQRPLPHVLFVGAYRANEVDAQHSVSKIRKSLQKAKADVTDIQLTGLDDACVRQLVADTCFTSTQEVTGLAQAIQDKVRGNPFFIRELFATLDKQGLLTYDLDKHQWQCQINDVKALAYADNVVDLCLQKVGELTEQTQHCLQIAACIGTNFSLDLLSIVSQLSTTQVLEQLWPALIANIIEPIGSDYKYLPADATSDTHDAAGEEDSPDTPFCFIHDRLQQATYEASPEEERPTYHYRIAAELLSQGEVADNDLFIVTNQLNAALPVVLSEHLELIPQLIELNYRAAVKAKLSAGHKVAQAYLESARAQLATDSWDSNYAMTLAIYTQLTEVAQLRGDYAAMDKFANVVFANAKQELDEARLYPVLLEALVAQNDGEAAIAQTIRFCGKLGVVMPRKVSKVNVLLLVLRVQRQLAALGQEKITQLPALRDEKIQLVLQLIYVAYPMLYFTDQNLLAWATLHAIRLMIKHGLTEWAIIGVTSLAAVEGSAFKQYKKSQQTFALAEHLVNQQHYSQRQGLMACIKADFIDIWRTRLTATSYQAQLDKAYQISVHVADYQFAAASLMAKSFGAFFLGTELPKLRTSSEADLAQIHRLHERNVATYVAVLLEMVEHLLAGKSNNLGDEGKHYSKQAVLATRSGVCALADYRIVLCYYTENHQNLLSYIKTARATQENASGILAEPSFYFYETLTLLKRSERKSTNVHRLRILANIHRFKKWKAHCKDNFGAKYHLLRAEYSRVFQQGKYTLHHGELAIPFAIRGEDLASLGIIHEIYYYYYRAAGLDRLAQDQLEIAMRYFRAWGIGVIADKRLARHYRGKEREEQLPSLLQKEDVDIIKVINTTQSISEETANEHLASYILQVALTTIGASRAVLLLTSEDELYLSARYQGDAIEEFPEASVAYEESPDYSIDVIENALRGHALIIENDIATNSDMCNDPVLTRERVKSVLCLPMVYKHKLYGVLYLENDHATHSFKQLARDVAGLISQQACVAIENSQLYRSFARFLPREFLDTLGKTDLVNLNLMDMKETTITIMFADIRGFTTFSENRDPTLVLNYLNDYLSVMTPVITQHNGFIDKYLGDGILAIFPDSADDSIRCSQAMFDTLKELNQHYAKQNLPPIKIGIGLDTGKVLLCLVGTRVRMDGTVIGDVVNSASRIEDLCKDYKKPIVISDHTKNALLAPQDFLFQALGHQVLRGKEEAVQLWTMGSGEKKTSD